MRMGRHKGIAWVDTSRMVSPQPVSQMVGQRITIFGDFERANNRPEIILFAKSIHPALTCGAELRRRSKA